MTLFLASSESSSVFLYFFPYFKLFSAFAVNAETSTPSKYVVFIDLHNAGVRIRRKKAAFNVLEKGKIFAFTHREASPRYPGLPNLHRLKFKTRTFTTVRLKNKI